MFTPCEGRVSNPSYNKQDNGGTGFNPSYNKRIGIGMGLADSSLWSPKFVTKCMV
jgi:hypothetical protein